MYSVATVYVSFTSLSNTPRSHKLSQNLICGEIFFCQGRVGCVVVRPTEKYQNAQNSTSKLVCHRDPLIGLRKQFSQIHQMLRRIIGLANRKYFSPCLPLTIILDSDIQMVSRILVHPIRVELIYHVVRYLEAGFQEVCHTF